MKNSKTNMRKLSFITLATMIAMPTTNLISNDMSTSTKAVVASTMRKRDTKKVRLSPTEKREKRKDLYHEKRENHRKIRHLKHEQHHHKRRLHHLERTNQGKSALAAKHRSVLKNIEVKIDELNSTIDTLVKKIEALS